MRVRSWVLGGGACAAVAVTALALTVAMTSSDPERAKETCIFCHIVRGDTQRDAVIYEDDLCTAFHDIKPDAQIHIQVVPREHVVSIAELGPPDMALVRHLRTVGEKLLDEMGHTGERRFGFHVPPFTSIKHLHMHTLGLPYRTLRGRLGFVSWGWWYKSTHDVIRDLEKGLTGNGKRWDAQHVRTRDDLPPAPAPAPTTADEPSTSTPS